MSPGPSHETPILLMLPAGTPHADAVLAILDDPEVRHIDWPAPWCLDEYGLDLCGAAPDLRQIDRSTFGRAASVWLGLADSDALDRQVERRWREVDAHVRDYYLGRGTLAAVRGWFFRDAARREAEVTPPAFRRDRILEVAVPIAYRLARGPEPFEKRAPAEEATICFLPFDPEGVEARREAGIEAGRGPTIEVYAYESGRARHLALVERIARAHPGWRVVDLGT